MRTVRLRGTWTRDETSSYDITGMRAKLRQYRGRADREKFVGMVSGELRATGKGFGTRGGTFDVEVLVPSYGTPEDKLVTRATQVLRWWLADRCCTAPKVTIDRSRSGVL